MTEQTNASVREISIGHGYITIIDAADYPLVSQFTWHAKVDRRKDGTIRNVYARRYLYGKRVGYLHQLLLGPQPKGLEIDHRNRNGLDNRRQNLRVGTISQNRANSRRRHNNKSGLKGVWSARGNGNRWRAGLRVNGTSIHLGVFTSKEDAARAYGAAARAAFGEFAYVDGDE